jgi:cytochrome b
MAIGPQPVRIWDLPVRLVHWSFVVLLPWLWWEAEEEDLDMHMKLGIVMLGLVVFRLLWGVLGSDTARFSRFVKGPGAILRYVRGQGGKTVIGHNPLGALSVLALLGLLTLQIGLGLIAQDVDGLNSGPLNYLVSFDTADAASELHELVFNVILGVVALHVGAILFYLVVKRDNLITPMITGRRRYDAVVEAPLMAPLWRLVVCVVAAFLIMWWVWAGAPLPGVN